MKALKRSLTVILIAALAVAAGFIYDRIAWKIDEMNYPRPAEYLHMVGKYAKEFGVPEYIVYAVIRTESSFKSDSLSHAGAVGLMQIIPDTFDWIAFLRKEQAIPALLYDPETNIKYGTYLLSYLYNEFEDWDKVYAAYNAGIGITRDWLANPSYTDESGNLENIPYKETREYIKKVNEAVQIYKRLYYTEVN
jgi:soluble lytic murein transglycosylase